MIQRTSYFATRVGRRILVLSVLTAVIPVVALALLSQRRVVEHLSEQVDARLTQTSKSLGLEIAQRMIVAGNVVQVRASLLAQSKEDGQRRVLLTDMPPGIMELRVGSIREMSDVPTAENLPDAARRQLAEGRPALLDGGSSTALWLVVRVPEPSRGELLWARLEPAYLWGTQRGSSSLPAGVDLCVFGSRRSPLFCSTPMPAAVVPFRVTLPATASVATFDWHLAGIDRRGAAWPLFLRHEFGANPWTVVASENVVDMLAPVIAFRKTFFLVVGTTLGIVVLFASWLIRRSLEPLGRLRQATERIAKRDFSHRVPETGRDEFGELARSFNGMTQEIIYHLEAIEASHDIDRAVLSELDRESIVDTVLTRARQALPWEVIIVVLPAPGGTKGRWQVATVDATGTVRRETRSLAFDPRGFSDQTLVHRGALVTDSDRQILEQIGCPAARSLLAFPVGGREGEHGVILVGGNEDLSWIDDAVRLTNRIADQVSIALRNATLVEELEAMHWGTLTAFARAIDAKSPWTAGHSERVTALALAIGRRMQIDDSQLELLRRGSLLHDIGKIGVPADILDKPAPLTQEERRLMNEHPVIGARILSPLVSYHNVLGIVRNHHERWDGLGYPDQLAGTAIPFLARVLTVADVFDAMTSPRPYRAGIDLETVASYIKQNSRIRFDPAVVSAFLALVQDPREDGNLLLSGIRPVPVAQGVGA